MTFASDLPTFFLHLCETPPPLRAGERLPLKGDRIVSVEALLQREVQHTYTSFSPEDGQTAGHVGCCSQINQLKATVFIPLNFARTIDGTEAQEIDVVIHLGGGIGHIYRSQSDTRSLEAKTVCRILKSRHCAPAILVLVIVEGDTQVQAVSVSIVVRDVADLITDLCKAAGVFAITPVKGGRIR